MKLTENMSYPNPIPVTRVISPSPTPSEAGSERDSYFAPVTRSAAKQQRHKSPEPIAEEKDGSGSDSSLEKRARSRSRDSVTTLSQLNGTASRPRRRMSGLTPKNPVKKSEPITNGNVPPEQSNGHLSPYDRMQKTWRDFSRSPSPLGLIPLHRHYRYLIHKHEIPRKALHVSIGFMTLGFYTHGIQTTAITPWLLGALVPIASVDFLRHRFPDFNRFYVRCLGALMRETEVDGYNGVIWYLLGAIIALQFYPKDIGTMSILLLSWCDTAASTFGRLYGRYTIRLRRGKSLAGTLAAFATGAITAVMFWGWLAPRTGTFPDDPPNGFMFKGQLGLPLAATRYLGWKDGSATIAGGAALMVMSVVTGVIGSISEFIDILGFDDNLTIPVLSSLGLFAVLKVFGQ
jgi:diacylglycerol kinase (CTP)